MKKIDKKTEMWFHYVVITLSVGYILVTNYYLMFPVLLIYGSSKVLYDTRRKELREEVKSKIKESFREWSANNLELEESNETTKSTVLDVNAGKIADLIYDPWIEDPRRVI